jgi:hypothetical protein
MSPQYRALTALLSTAVVLTACADAPPTGPLTTASSRAMLAPAPDGLFHRFVSIGTSVSMGWQSDGAIAATQAESWNAQLARLAGRSQSAPLISGTGCRSPLMAPLASGVRLSGESAAAQTFSCAPLEAGMIVPSQNVAIAAAKTRDALLTTPETQPDAFYKLLYPQILPPHTTQVQAALTQKPKFVSVELGANDVLDARIGIAIPGATITPFTDWAKDYDRVIEAVSREVKHGLLVGLITDAGDFPSFRRGAEIWADAQTLLYGFHVAVQADCGSVHSENLLFVPVLIPTVIQAGLTSRAQGGNPVALSCAGAGPTTRDFILTPGEVAIVNSQMAQMNAHIKATAERIGFAHMELEALYGLPDLKPPFNAAALMTSHTPYGALISLDGIHPSTHGHAVIATAAARAINQRYGLQVPTSRAWMAFR